VHGMNMKSVELVELLDIAYRSVSNGKP